MQLLMGMISYIEIISTSVSLSVLQRFVNVSLLYLIFCDIYSKWSEETLNGMALVWVLIYVQPFVLCCVSD